MDYSFLQSYDFTERESKIYLAALELWNAIVSSIARKAGEHRVSTYSILKDLKSRGISQEITKNWVKYYSVISPEELLKKQKEKYQKLEAAIPELMALTNLYNNKPKIYYYDTLDLVMSLFKEIVDAWDALDSPFKTFVGTQNIDSKFEDFFAWEFKNYRQKQKHPTQAILFDKDSKYSHYHLDNYETCIVGDQIFDISNEIVLYGWKVAILSYNTDEIYALVIESESLYKFFNSMFSYIWKTSNK